MEKANLVHHGTNLMLDRVLKDLQAEDESLQARALQALQGFAKGKRGGVTMTRNHTSARKEAIEAGAVPALCSVLGTGDDEPVSIEVLKALYTIIAPDSSGHTTTEVFASGGVHALIRLLENVLEFAAEPQRSVWVREVLALLYPLVRRSRMVARLMASEMAGVCVVLQTVADPLCLSLALDIMEEVLGSGDRRRYGRLMAREGALAALVHAAHVRGMGAKAMLVLATLAAEPELLHVLRALLQPQDYACLVHIAHRAADADDLDGKACVQLLAAVLSGPGIEGVRALALGRCLGASLCLTPIASDLLIRATGDAGVMALQNLPADAVAEAAIAAALLLEHTPLGASLLLRPGALTALLDTVLDENSASLPEHAHRAEATEALAGAAQWLLKSDAPNSRRTTGSDSGEAAATGPEAKGGTDSVPASAAPAKANGPSANGHADAAAGVSPKSQQDARATESDGIATPSGNFETMTFHVGGKEFYALAWVLAQSSRAIAQTLAQIPDTSAAAVVIPDVPGLTSARMYEVFSLAAECAYTGNHDVALEDCLDLWALAASLQMPDIQRRCERLAPAILNEEGSLERALSLTRGHRDSGAGLREVVAQHVLTNLMSLRERGTLGRLAQQHRRELTNALNVTLRRRLHAARPMPTLGRSSSQFLAASTNGDSPRSARSISSSRFGGVVGASRFSATTDAWTVLERQGSQAAASTISLDSPTSTLPAKSSVESFSKESAVAAVAQ
ncbi:hypothetical protein WJX75_004438 [Coccomyxa subellipsoidea]|uniref:BTB domain-containing protein n=1 Tax=Coccomyxa subellipsoidea TaxID=248742 RepID=A0ABR2Z0L4_9CHLO